MATAVFPRSAMAYPRTLPGHAPRCVGGAWPSEVRRGPARLDVARCGRGVAWRPWWCRPRPHDSTHGFAVSVSLSVIRAIAVHVMYHCVILVLVLLRQPRGLRRSSSDGSAPCAPPRPAQQEEEHLSCVCSRAALRSASSGGRRQHHAASTPGSKRGEARRGVCGLPGENYCGRPLSREPRRRRRNQTRSAFSAALIK